MRRKYPEWTLYPKSIQEQRVQLAGLLEAFRYFPFAAASGSMLTVRNQLITEGFFVGTFPYPTIYPSSLETKLPVATTQWARFMPFWQYTGRGFGKSASYYIGFIVVDVTTDPKEPRIKSSASMLCNPTAMSGACFETIVPSSSGSWLFSVSDNVNVSSWDVETVTFTPKDELYVAMAFCQETLPVNNTDACLSYYVPPETVLKPQV